MEPAEKPATWWQRAVVYQIYPRSFQDTTGNGVGDLRGIENRLAYVATTLGADAVWISPFYPSPMADFGYDVTDYCDVDPLFGSLDDFDDVLAHAHDLGLAVIIDWVPNHTSDQHAWFQASRSSRDDPKRDWYVWRDANADGSEPNNWLSVFGGPAWEWDERTGQYYLHSFLVSQPDLNWRNPEVVSSMLDTLRFWLDRGVDGFRIDVAHFVMKDPELRDNPPAVKANPFKDHGDYDAFDHIYDKGHEDAHGVFREIRKVLDSYPGDRFAVGEIHVFDWEEWGSYYGENLDELHMPFNFSLMFVPWDAGEIRSRVDAMEAALPQGAWPNHVLGNHDEKRLSTRFGAPRARVAAMLLLTLRGTPTLYYGDEIGLPQAEIAGHLQQDPWGLQVPGQGRDGCRTPMQWSPEPGAGFSPADGETPWLPFTEDADERNVERQLADPASLLNLYRTLLQLRKATPALRDGDYRALESPDGVFVFERTLGSERVLVALNFTDTARIVDLGSGTVLCSTDPERPAADVADRVVLGPDEGVVLAPA